MICESGLYRDEGSKLMREREREKERVGALEESWDLTPHLTEFKDISMLV